MTKGTKLAKRSPSEPPTEPRLEDDDEGAPPEPARVRTDWGPGAWTEQPPPVPASDLWAHASRDARLVATAIARCERQLERIADVLEHHFGKVDVR